MMPRPRRGLSVVATKRRRIDSMCFSGSAPKPPPVTKIEYEKPDFGPLPSLGIGEPVQRQGAEYQPVRSGSATRSLLMPLVMK
jgi:hypothetical protein